MTKVTNTRPSGSEWQNALLLNMPYETLSPAVCICVWTGLYVYVCIFTYIYIRGIRLYVYFTCSYIRHACVNIRIHTRIYMSIGEFMSNLLWEYFVTMRHLKNLATPPLSLPPLPIPPPMPPTPPPTTTTKTPQPSTPPPLTITTQPSTPQKQQFTTTATVFFTNTITILINVDIRSTSPAYVCAYISYDVESIWTNEWANNRQTTVIWDTIVLSMTSL